MKPGRLNLPTIWRGCDYAPIIFKWKDLNGNPIDLTNYFALASTNLFDLNAQITDPLNGVTQISLTNQQTLALQLGEQPWSWLFEYLPTNVRFPPLLAGKVLIAEPTTVT